MIRIGSFLLFSVAFALPVRAQVPSARPGAGYVSRALTGGVPVGAIRGQYPGTTEPVLFVVNHPTPDSTALSAFVGGRLARRLVLPLPVDQVRFLGADIPMPEEESGAPPRGFAAFDFSSDHADIRFLWNHAADKWAFVARTIPSGTFESAGEIEWFGSEIMNAQQPQSEPRSDVTELDRDGRWLAVTRTTSLRIERTTFDDYTLSYRTAVYNNEVGPMQLMDGNIATQVADLDDVSAQGCSGLPAVTDVNRDGYADFWLCDQQWMNGVQQGAYRIYDPSAGLFVEDLAFSFTGNHRFDPNGRTIRTAMDWFAGRNQSHSEYDLSSGLPVLVRERKREVDYDCSECPPRFTTRELQSGRMRVTENRLGTTDEFLPEDFLGPATAE